jgi:hypothetical protein
MISFQLLCYYQSDIFSVHNASAFMLFSGVPIKAKGGRYVFLPDKGGYQALQK